MSEAPTEQPTPEENESTTTETHHEEHHTEVTSSPDEGDNTAQAGSKNLESGDGEAGSASE